MTYLKCALLCSCAWKNSERVVKGSIWHIDFVVVNEVFEKADTIQIDGIGQRGAAKRVDFERTERIGFQEVSTAFHAIIDDCEIEREEALRIRSVQELVVVGLEQGLVLFAHLFELFEIAVLAGSIHSTQRNRTGVRSIPLNERKAQTSSPRFVPPWRRKEIFRLA